MTRFSSFVRNTRLWAMLCLAALGLTVLLSLFGHLVAPRLWDAASENMRAAGRIMVPSFLGLFLLLGFSALPLVTNLFVAGLERLWSGTGLPEHPLHAKVMAQLRRHQVHVVVLLWCLYGAGLILAAPYMIRDWESALRNQ